MFDYLQDSQFEAFVQETRVAVQELFGAWKALQNAQNAYETAVIQFELGSWVDGETPSFGARQALEIQRDDAFRVYKHVVVHQVTPLVRKLREFHCEELVETLIGAMAVCNAVGKSNPLV